ncbi:uncharacterized protein L969DRAFT_91293 [Mixia osmundae IAM 14324]|uniref:MOSC domain-containing protein n=1 Tax=Mixia osmundae (strain CBS 9802 / IAM 14324 / JCM 22182 / KY 12970) TaxID=764103 RepID=G7DSS0_MIXOS|nr:uncharacterized protein L969DRAFT_91293 [Mixia osmundae IAM 14324]KEI41812.1 hypothetical protein L969DRAFT_91293 [Mixia osmundae IAM 14324]GAA93628.1 hypothetical protein E5Q_00272 [Mixia osmundae IAM 14324]
MASSSHSWTEALAAHPVFDPVTSTVSSAQADVPIELATPRSSAKSPFPASPGLSPIGSPSGSGSGLPSWTRSASHRGPSQAAAVTPDASRQGHRQRMAIIRDSELLVAVGNQLRLTSLSEIKSHASSSRPPSPCKRSSYKTLTSDLLTFEIDVLVPSPNGRLLAVVGESQLVVLVLPRLGWASRVSADIPCRAVPVGAYHHGPQGSARIARAIWHPWGDNQSTMLVLTADAILREYDLSRDHQDPVQTLDFSSATLTPSKNRRGRPDGRFSGEEPEAYIAVSLALGAHDAQDWSPLTLYCLMQNGDIYAVAPYLPQRAQIPLRYLADLSAHVTAQMRTAETPQKRATMQAQSSYVRSLEKQSQATSVSTLSSTRDEPTVQLHPPEDLPRRHMTRQGPFLLQPEPLELSVHSEDSSIDCFACDFLFARHSLAAPKQTAHPVSLGVFVIVFTDGKIDVCIETEPIQASWSIPQDTDLPALTVYETIKVETVPVKGNHSIASLTRDPLYDDTIYVQHSLGAHCLVLGTWIRPLMLAMAGEASEVAKTIRQDTPTDVVCILRTSASSAHEMELDALLLINDVYLGYSLLMMTRALQCVALELSIRLAAEMGYADELPPLTDGTHEPGAYISLVAKPTFRPPELLSAARGLPSSTRMIVPPSQKGRDLQITPETLQFLGKAVEQLRREIRDLVAAANVVQARLELQMRELSRQLSKLEQARQRMLPSTTRSANAEERLSRCAKVQADIMERADRMLQRLMDHHQPMISTYERQWFQELDRLEREISIDGTGSGRSLVDRVAKLETQVAVVRSQLTHVDGRQKQSEYLAEDQKREIYSQLATNSEILDQVQLKASKLADSECAHIHLMVTRPHALTLPDLQQEDLVVVSLCLLAFVILLWRRSTAPRTTPAADTIDGHDAIVRQLYNDRVTIARLRVYPIKSCRGFDVEREWPFTEQGLEYDRNWMIVDLEKNKQLSARDDRGIKLVRVMPLIVPDAQSPFGGELKITFLDAADAESFSVPLRPTDETLAQWNILEGFDLWGDSCEGVIVQSLAQMTDLNAKSPSELLSAFVGRPVKLVMKTAKLRRMAADIPLDPNSLEYPGGGVVRYPDFAPFLICSTASIADSEAHVHAHAAKGSEWAAPQSKRLLVERFRPNVIVQGVSVPWGEDHWLESTIGDQGRFYTPLRCPRCMFPNVDVESGIRDKQMPNNAMRKYRIVEAASKGTYCFGMYMIPARAAGILRLGDEVKVTRAKWNPEYQKE